MQYDFKLLTPHNIYEAAQFVQENEYRCINLAEQLRLCLYPEYAARYKKAAVAYACPQEEKVCCGVLLFSVHGILLHCIDTAVPQEVCEAFARFFLEHGFAYTDLHAVAGTHTHTLLLEKLIMQETAAMQTDAAVNYYLMRRLCPCAASFSETCTDFLKTAQLKANTALTIERATEADLDELFPLQFDYENTEVAYKGRPIDPTVSRLSLRVRLTNEFVYKVSANGQIVAKAGTNAQGFHWFQIGGVYTRPEYRNKGLAAAAVAHLISAHCAEKHGFALFVKTTNGAACRVYEKLKFERCGLFRMSYWTIKQT